MYQKSRDPASSRARKACTNTGITGWIAHARSRRSDRSVGCPAGYPADWSSCRVRSLVRSTSGRKAVCISSDELRMRNPADRTDRRDTQISVEAPPVRRHPILGVTFHSCYYYFLPFDLRPRWNLCYTSFHCTSEFPLPHHSSILNWNNICHAIPVVAGPSLSFVF
jgi:hypothetical protein